MISSSPSVTESVSEAMNEAQQFHLAIVELSISFSLFPSVVIFPAVVTILAGFVVVSRSTRSSWSTWAARSAWSSWSAWAARAATSGWAIPSRAVSVVGVVLRRRVRIRRRLLVISPS